ncbi:MAG TPA: hypothetical protein VGQ99_06015 [Tepidisphaeraceae bacterium]|jgi:hypothetical protein|nr:hypothetical protein [Tepidisphaeraceae bacterium]
MRFHVTGQNKDTGARMSLEFEADSKAAAQRKATSAGMNVPGMNVHRVEIAGQSVGPTSGIVPGGRGGKPLGIHPLLRLLISALGIAVLGYLLWPKLKPLVQKWM